MNPSRDLFDLLPPSGGPLDAPLAGAGISGLTAAVSAKLAKGLGAETVRDLLELIPRRYIDLSRRREISACKIGEDATVTAKIVRIDGRYVRSKRHILTVTVSDGTGALELVWWNQPFRARAFVQGKSIAVAGKIERGRGKIVMTNPFTEAITEGPGVHVGRIIPVHPATTGVTATQIRRFVHEGLKRFGEQIVDPLPPRVAEQVGGPARREAIEQMHFPDGIAQRDAARQRLAFEELFVLSTGLAVRKHRLARASDGIVMVDHENTVGSFLDALPFEPTGAQRRVIEQIATDMATPLPMNRLLQGEVGSGKTVVAISSALIAAAAGMQTALMAPTEVLAEQHYLSVKAMLDPIGDLAPEGEGRLFGGGYEVVLLTGSVTGKARTAALEAARSGSATILVGTHALIQEGVEFKRLGLAIIDEQHRFGVHQRVALRSKAGESVQPDVLIMTATPIPRTLTLTLYGDLEVSTLDEMPKGRAQVETLTVSDDVAREAAYQHVREQAASGHQAFIICPLVEDSPSLEAKAAQSEYERLGAEVFPDLRLGLLHGRMRSEDKEQVMSRFRRGETDILVATTVIEVGVDVPNATVMVIEDADRFGLSQLHQLRGRVGRGKAPSRCFLFTGADPTDEDRAEAFQRLRAMERTNNGLELAELDLRLRGGGQLFGRKLDEAKGAPAQTGRGDLRFANLLRDLALLERAREVAFALVDDDPTLSDPAHHILSEEMRRRFADRLDWLSAS